MNNKILHKVWIIFSLRSQVHLEVHQERLTASRRLTVSAIRIKRMMTENKRSWAKGKKRSRTTGKTATLMTKLTPPRLKMLFSASLRRQDWVLDLILNGHYHLFSLLQITRVQNRWKFQLIDGIMNINGPDYVFLKENGEAIWWSPDTNYWLSNSLKSTGFKKNPSSCIAVLLSYFLNSSY